MEAFDVIVIGGGPAGLTAAIYVRRAGKSVLVLERGAVGGQIVLSAQVENFPGCVGLSGQELAERMYDQAVDLGARVELEEVLCIQDGTPKIVTTDCGAYHASALILATGMRRRMLGLPREGELPGVSCCAVCDGVFYTGKDIAVCGGGNTALQDALFLAAICRQVTLIHRRETFRGDPILLEALRTKPNVAILTDTVVAALQGTDCLTGLTLRNTRTGQVQDLPVSALFLAIGQIPETQLAASLALTDTDGFLPAGENCRTPIPGIFTAGDCRTKSVRQLITACADGAVAALAAVESLEPKSRVP